MRDRGYVMAGWGALIQLAMKIGPKAWQFIKTLGPIIAANPDAMNRAKEFLDKAWAAQKEHTPTARLRRTVAVVKGQALKLEEAATDAQAKEKASRWVDQADKLAGAIDLLDVRQGARRRAEFRILKAEVDTLFTEVLDASVKGGDTF
jgi:hypothetical protein